MKFLIIIPCSQRRRKHTSVLRIAENQTFQDFKCVIVNDGSTDKTQQIVENFINSVTLSGVEALSFKGFKFRKIRTSTRRKSRENLQ